MNFSATILSYIVNSKHNSNNNNNKTELKLRYTKSKQNHTSKKVSTSIKGDAFHNSTLQILLYHFGKVPLQRVCMRPETTTFVKTAKTQEKGFIRLKRDVCLPIIGAFMAHRKIQNLLLGLTNLRISEA